jgi:hypothetical protein
MAYSADCEDCRTSRLTPVRFVRQPGTEVTVDVDIGGDMKCLCTLVGKQGCSALHFCPKCDISIRQMPAGRVHVGWVRLSEEQKQLFESDKKQDKAERGKKKTFVELARSYPELTTPIMCKWSSEQKDDKFVHSQAESPLMPHNFDYTRQIACMPLHVTLGMHTHTRANAHTHAHTQARAHTHRHARTHTHR